MKRDALVFINHINNEIDKIISSTKNLTIDSLEKNNLLRDATIRRIELIGEASKNLPENFKKKYPNIPFKDIIGMRDKLVHHYFGVDIENIFKVVKEDIPELKKQINKILKETK